MSLHILLGRMRYCIEYVGMALMAVLMSVRRPAGLRKFIFQLESLTLMLSIKWRKLAGLKYFFRIEIFEYFPKPSA